MRINNNLMAMNTHRQLGIGSNNAAKSMEKLSSGFRINRAGDDAAGLAISEKMRGQIRGLNQASRNAQDGISLIQTAEGALNETHAILQRMRELAVQSSNDTNVEIDRDAIQNEIDQLTSEIDRIGNTTEFNTRKLLNGSANVGTTVTGTVSAISVLGGTGDTKISATVTITASTTASGATTTATDTALASATYVLTTASTVSINGVDFNFGTAATSADVKDAINNAGIGVTAELDATGLKITSTAVGSGAKIDIESATGQLAAMADATGADATITTTEGYTYTAKGNTITIASGNAEGLEFKLNEATSADTVITVKSNGTLGLQIGANQGQDMNVSLKDMRSSALGVSGIDVSTREKAAQAITTINDSITSVSTERAKLGAYQNRLEHTIKNLDTSSENLQASESRIRDVDMAKEMMNFSKNNILQQAAQAMLAQANQAPQGVLQLLR